jgi:hypothetical protein
MIYFFLQILNSYLQKLHAEKVWKEEEAKKVVKQYHPLPISPAQKKKRKKKAGQQELVDGPGKKEDEQRDSVMFEKEQEKKGDDKQGDVLMIELAEEEEADKGEKIKGDKRRREGRGRGRGSGKGKGRETRGEKGGDRSEPPSLLGFKCPSPDELQKVRLFSPYLCLTFPSIGTGGCAQ